MTLEKALIKASDRDYWRKLKSVGSAMLSFFFLRKAPMIPIRENFMIPVKT